MALHALFMRFPFSYCFNFHAAVFFHMFIFLCSSLSRSGGVLKCELLSLLAWALTSARCISSSVPFFLLFSLTLKLVVGEHFGSVRLCLFLFPLLFQLRAYLNSSSFQFFFSKQKNRGGVYAHDRRALFCFFRACGYERRTVCCTAVLFCRVL